MENFVAIDSSVGRQKLTAASRFLLVLLSCGLEEIVSGAKIKVGFYILNKNLYI